jgi:phosphate starvation-inducible PhoH-like protein
LEKQRKVESITKNNFDDNNLVQNLFGEKNKNLKFVENLMGVKINVKGSNIAVWGDEPEVKLASKLLDELYTLLKKGYPLYTSDFDYAIRILSGNNSANLQEIFLDAVYIPTNKRVITPKSIAQKEYIEAIRRYDIVFGIGPAGTGKTYLAMALAMNSLNKKEVERIILTRPAVEAGEKLGFLPGDLYEKVNPYLRPLYDAIYDMVDFEKAASLVQRGQIEIAPLAFMRGRTLNNSFVILDEAQNTTTEQMKMFLTRLGHNSKAVITGDITQIDLPDGKPSGLVEAQEILAGIGGIKFSYFTEKDVVRHRLVQDIIKAYEDMEKRKDKKE